ncbi:MAG TPA: polyketide synthase [Steroidobacteraceae bacterium]|jgi:polyketide biosynthesis enoyl-CoA hydratase PksI
MSSTSQVVRIESVGAGVAQITMQDEVHRNSFTDDLAAQLRAAFAEVANDARYRVVILTGYEGYFCSGGTAQALRDLHAGRATFADARLYGLPMDCEIPVIAAMHGHAMGGGFVFGLFSDIVLLARECVYTANFMRYGFTPGMGATCVLPTKLGVALAAEMLLAARSYRGGELERRGVPCAVLRRSEVLAHARQLASEMADKPRPALVALKHRLTRELAQKLPEAIAQELVMHGQTLHEPEVGRRIDAHFGI